MNGKHYPNNYVPATPTVPRAKGLLERIGDWLNIAEVIIIAGQYPRNTIYRLLRFRGVRVKRVGYQAAANAPWWNFWSYDTYVVVERHYGGMAMEILEAEGYEVLNGDSNE